MKADIPPPRKLPCGCVVDCAINEKGENQTTLIACRAGLKCQYVVYFMEEGKRQEKPLEVREL